MNSRRLERAGLALLLAAGALAGLGLGSLMPFGPGLRDDSSTYLMAAETLARTGSYGRMTALGEVRPVVNFPPMYSLALSLAERSGLPPLEATRVLHQLLFAILVVATGASLFAATRSPWAASLGVVLVLVAVPLTIQFTWTQSEPLFLVLVEFGVLAAFLYRARRGGEWLLVLSGALFGVAAVTRYAGIGIACGVLVTLWAGSGKSRRLRDTLLFLPVALLPLLLFLIRNGIVAGSAANRPSPFWHPPSFAAWASGAETVLTWVLPDRAVALLGPAGSVAAAAVVATALGYVLVRLAADPPAWPRLSIEPLEMARLLSGAILGYVATILVTAFVLDRLIPLNDRILAPVYYLILQLVTLGIAVLATSGRRVVILGVLLIAFLGMQGIRTAALVRALRADGQGYRSREWRESQVVRFVCELPSVPIYSNDVPALYFACARIPFPLPSRINAADLEPNPAYDAEVAAFEEATQNRGGLVAILGWYGEDRLDRIGASELVAGLRPFATFDDGVVYGR